MGWCSGTDIFDITCKAVFNSKTNTDDAKSIIKEVATKLEEMDWDCQKESDYWDKPIIQEIFKELHPDWFEDG